LINYSKIKHNRMRTGCCCPSWQVGQRIHVGQHLKQSDFHRYPDGTRATTHCGPLEERKGEHSCSGILELTQSVQKGKQTTHPTPHGDEDASV
jgi:hypothetical protein